MWNISHAWIMYLLFLVALGICGWGVYQRIQFWRKGKEDRERLSDWGLRFRVLIREILLQRQVRNSTFPGIFHSLIFYSFVVLVATTLIIMLQYDSEHFLGLKVNLFHGFVYVFFSVASELAGFLILFGIGMAAWRRYWIRPETVPNTRSDAIALLFLAVIVVTGYLAEGLRIAVIGDPWKELSPIGWAVSLLFRGAGEQAGKAAHASLWWAHTVFAMGWIALIPYTKFVHLLSLPTNVFFQKLKPRVLCSAWILRS